MNSLLERPPAVTRPHVRLIQSGRDIAAYLREALVELPAPAMWDEISHAAGLVGRDYNCRGLAAAMLGYVEDHCEERRCDWCGMCQCGPDCAAPEHEPREYPLEDVDGYEKTGSATGIFSPAEFDAWLEVERTRG